MVKFRDLRAASERSLYTGRASIPSDAGAEINRCAVSFILTANRSGPQCLTQAAPATQEDFMTHPATGPPPPRSNSPNRFVKHVNAYGLAAGAAGVSLMALAQPAEAEIIFTPADSTIPFNKLVTIDLNHDGNPDFQVLLLHFRLSLLPRGSDGGSG